jgi:hypothetical protein
MNPRLHLPGQALAVSADSNGLPSLPYISPRKPILDHYAHYYQKTGRRREQG